MESDQFLAELAVLYKNLQSASLKHVETINEAGDNSSKVMEIITVTFSPMEVRLDEIITNVSSEHTEYIKLLAMKASVLYEKAKIFMNMSLCQESYKHLTQAKEIVCPLKENKFILYLYLRIMNHLSYILSKLGDYVMAREVLERTLEIVINYDIAIYNTEELFSGADPDESLKASKIHRLKINNMQMLSWIFSKMGLTNESSIEQHMILIEEHTFGEIDEIEWAGRCARVSVLHLTQEDWVIARYYLVVAGAALDRVETENPDNVQLKKAYADLGRGWIYYGLRLFDNSRSQEMERACSRLFEENVTEDINIYQEQPFNEAFLLPDNHPSTLPIIPTIPAALINTSQSALALFTHTHNHMKRARSYYTLRDHPFIHVNCILDLSELYRYLAYFSNPADLELQYSYQMRRGAALDTLCAVLREVRPQCYASVSVELFRELAEVQIEMLGLNLKRIANLGGDQCDDKSNRATDGIQRRIDATTTIQERLERFGQDGGSLLRMTELDESEEVGGGDDSVVPEEDSVGKNIAAEVIGEKCADGKVDD